MEHRKSRYYVGLLSAAQYHGAAHHRPQEFQVVTDGNRPAITCGAVKVVFVSRGNLALVPVERFNNPRGSVVVSSAEATAIDLVGNMRRAGGLDRVAGALSELSEKLDPGLLAKASESAPVLWAQRLGYLLDFAGAGEKTTHLKESVRRRAKNYTKLLPGADAGGSPSAKDWRLIVNAKIEMEA